MNGQGVNSIQETHGGGQSCRKALILGLTVHCCQGGPGRDTLLKGWALVSSRLLYARGQGRSPPHPAD